MARYQRIFLLGLAGAVLLSPQLAAGRGVEIVAAERIQIEQGAGQVSNQVDLRLDCTKIARAQRELGNALKQPPRLRPLADESKPEGAPAIGADAQYHIERNLARMAGLSQQFACDQR